MAGSRQCGAGRFNLLLAVTFTAVLVYAGYLVIPPCIANFELEDAMQNEVRIAYLGHQPDMQIQDDIFKETKNLGIPVRRQDIRVQWSGDGVRISVDYDVPLNLPGYRYLLTFHPHADSRLI
jgi:hypothetical protein